MLGISFSWQVSACAKFSLLLKYMQSTQMYWKILNRVTNMRQSHTNLSMLNMIKDCQYICGDFILTAVCRELYSFWISFCLAILMISKGPRAQYFITQNHKVSLVNTDVFFQTCIEVCASLYSKYFIIHWFCYIEQ